MSGNIPCYLAVHEVCCLPVSAGGSFPTILSLLLPSSRLFYHHQSLPCWAVGSRLSGALSPPILHLYLPDFASTPWNDVVEVRCTYKVWRWPGRAQKQDRGAMGMAKQAIIFILPVLRDKRTCRALWLTSASHFPQQSMFPAPLGRTSVGTVPVSLPFQSFAFLSLIWLFLWAQCKDASKERKPLMPQQFIKKKRRLLNLEAVEPVVLFSWSRR